MIGRPDQRLLEAAAEMARALEALRAAVASGDKYGSLHPQSSMHFSETNTTCPVCAAIPIPIRSVAAEAAQEDILEALKKNMAMAKYIAGKTSNSAKKVHGDDCDVMMGKPRLIPLLCSKTSSHYAVRWQTTSVLSKTAWPVLLT